MPKSPYRAVRELERELCVAYERLLAVLLIDMREAIALFAPLAKAEPKRPASAPELVALLRRLAAAHHLAFVAEQFPYAVDQGELAAAAQSGDLPEALAARLRSLLEEPRARGLLAEAFDFGAQLARPGARGEISAMSVAQVRKRPRPRLTQAEREARNWAEQRAATFVTGLGQRVGEAAAGLTVEQVRRQLGQNVGQRKGWRDLGRQLGQRSSDWARDFARIAATEKTNALQQGLASALLAREGDPKSTRVAKLVAPDGCDRCVALHLTAGRGSPPKIFRLAELIENGSNVGRRQAQWRSTVGPIHPWCHCELVHVPNGFEFDDRGDLVPASLERAQLLHGDLRKAGGNLTYGCIVPERGVTVALPDPVKRAIAEEVIAATPREVFDRRVGVTYVCEDLPRVDNPMTEHDLGYWTGNEIRVAVGLPAAKLAEVLRHEFGHSLNVYLMHQWGGVRPVVRWHNALFEVSRREGFVSAYARTAPIENAAELTRLYLYDRRRLISEFPRAFARLDAAYRGIWRQRELPEAGELLLTGERSKAARDQAERAQRGNAPL